MFIPIFKKKVMGENFCFFIKYYLVICYWKSLLTIKITTLRKGFHGVSTQDGGLAIFTTFH